MLKTVSLANPSALLFRLNMLPYCCQLLAEIVICSLAMTIKIFSVDTICQFFLMIAGKFNSCFLV